MADETTYDDLLNTVEQALEHAGQPRRRESAYTIVVALSELGAWLADERQSGRARRTNWESLIDDVVRALCATGPALGSVLDRDSRQRELKAIKKALPARDGLDAATRRRLATVWRELDEHARSAGARTAALDDAINAARGGFERALEPAAILLGLGDAYAGPDELLGRWLRNEIGGDRVTHRPPEERVARVREVLAEEAGRARQVVWLRIDYAVLDGLGLLELGPNVSLVSAARLRAALERDDDDQVFALAPELRKAADEMDFMLPGGEHDGDRPVLLMRVLFDSETRPRARSRSFQTAETIAGLVCLYGANPGTWVVDDSFATYTDGRRGGTSSKASETRRIPAFPGLAMIGAERAAQSLAAIAEELGAKLPVADGEIAEAGQLLHWMQQARAATPAARVLLCDRIIEQVAGWAGVGEPERFITDYLIPRLLRRKIRSEVADTAFDVNLILSHGGVTADVLGSWCEPGNLSGAINLEEFLKALDQVREALELSDSPVLRDNLLTLTRVRTLADAQQSVSKRRRWVRQSQEDYDHREARRWRTRNSLVHGGPLSDATIGAVAPYTEALAMTALGLAIEGRLAGRDLIDHFLEEARASRRVFERLDAGVSLADALFG